MVKSLSILTLLAVILAGLYITDSIPSFSTTADHTSYSSPLVIKTRSGKQHPFKVEIASTAEKQKYGLMYRTSMPTNAGMLFDYSTQPRHVGMWMKNTEIPLDILFINTRGIITSIIHNTTPHSLTPLLSQHPVAAALELNAGTAEKLNISVNDTVIHEIFVP